MTTWTTHELKGIGKADELRIASLPSQKTSWPIKNGKMTRLDAAPSPTGGVPGILAQLGIIMPM